MLMIRRFYPNDENDFLKVGDVVANVNDIYYGSLEDSIEGYGSLEDIPKYFKIFDRKLYIPSGTVMTYLGNKYNCWPTFQIGELDDLECAGDPFELLILNMNKKEIL